MSDEKKIEHIKTEIEEIKEKLTTKTKNQSGQQQQLIQLIDQLMSQFEKTKEDLNKEQEKNSKFEQTNKEIETVLKNLQELYTNNKILQTQIDELGTILQPAPPKGGYRYKLTRSKSKRKNKSKNKSRRLSGNLTRKKRYRL